MSSHVKAIILRDLKDIECVKETLEQLNVTFIKKGSNLELSNSIIATERRES